MVDRVKANTAFIQFSNAGEQHILKALQVSDKMQQVCGPEFSFQGESYANENYVAASQHVGNRHL
ncbi:MAG TPA: hypothetical protein DIW81_25695 [Planctomycetaceae bacterium]|nr:hypothetical protein [Rubinisphaera sp.]HCS54939.1 hypothetical protein [Planctomycetaceae bacterium]